MKDNFSAQADLYAQYRPAYPADLFNYIVSFVDNKDTAWDCGTGNGQSAAELSRHFKKVIATDISSKQIANAEKKNNIIYSIEPAEDTSIETGSINLVTVAQAIHWFNFEKFYKEVKRVAAPGAFIAVWAYSLLKIDEQIDQIIHDYHFNFLGNYWDAERKYVDDEYRNIPFPFQKINAPQFVIEKYWSLAVLEGYLNTWSALQKYIQVNGSNPVPGIIHSVKAHWGSGERKKIIFPIHLLIGAIK